MSDDKKPRRSSSNPRWAAIQELFQAFYAVRDLDAADPARKLAKDRLFEALLKEMPELAKAIARKRAPRGVGIASPTEIGKDMEATFWSERGITQLAGQYDPDKASFYTWVSRVLANEFNDWTRQRVRAAEKPFGEDEQDLLEAHLSAGGRQIGMVTQLFGQELNQAVADLRPELRDVVVLRVHEDLTVEATAERLGISTATVKRRQKDAYDLLREVLGGN